MGLAYKSGVFNMARIILFIFFVGFFGVVNLRAVDWPNFLGPNKNGISTETGLIGGWSTGGPKVEWKKQIGTGYSAPSIRDKRIVLFHRIGNEEIVDALDVKMAKRIWRYSYPSRYRDPFGYNNGPRCSPLLTEKYCFTYGAEGLSLIHI